MKKIFSMYVVLSFTIFMLPVSAFDGTEINTMGNNYGGSQINSWDSSLKDITNDGQGNFGMNFDGHSHVDWQNFNINQGQTLNFNAVNDATGLTILNTVSGGNMSEVHGAINANQGISNLIFSNPAGLLFDGATITTAADVMLTNQPMMLNTDGTVSVDTTKTVSTMTLNNGAGSYGVQIINGTSLTGGNYQIVSPSVNINGSTFTNTGKLTLKTDDGFTYFALANGVNKEAKMTSAMINGNLEINSSDGLIQISDSTITGNTKLTSTNGDILIGTTKNADGTYNYLNPTDGTRSVNIGGDTEIKATGTGKAIVNSLNNDKHLDISTVNGRIQITDTDVNGTYSAEIDSDSDILIGVDENYNPLGSGVHFTGWTGIYQYIGNVVVDGLTSDNGFDVDNYGNGKIQISDSTFDWTFYCHNFANGDILLNVKDNGDGTYSNIQKLNNNNQLVDTEINATNKRNIWLTNNKGGDIIINNLKQQTGYSTQGWNSLNIVNCGGNVKMTNSTSNDFFIEMGTYTDRNNISHIGDVIVDNANGRLNIKGGGAYDENTNNYSDNAYAPGNVTVTNSTSSSNLEFDTTSIYANGNITLKDNNITGKLSIGSQGDSSKTILLADDPNGTAVTGNICNGNTTITATNSNVQVNNLTNNGNFTVTTTGGNIQVADSTTMGTENLTSSNGNILIDNTSAPASTITTSARAEITGNGTGNITVVADTLKVATAANSRNYTFQFNTIRDNVTKTVLPSEELSYVDANGLDGLGGYNHAQVRASGTTYLEIPEPQQQVQTRANVVESSATTMASNNSIMENQTSQTLQEFNSTAEEALDNSITINVDEINSDENQEEKK